MIILKVSTLVKYLTLWQKVLIVGNLFSCGHKPQKLCTASGCKRSLACIQRVISVGITYGSEAFHNLWDKIDWFALLPSDSEQDHAISEKGTSGKTVRDPPRRSPPEACGPMDDSVSGGGVPSMGPWHCSLPPVVG